MSIPIQLEKNRKAAGRAFAALARRAVAPAAPPPSVSSPAHLDE
jgi:hypothetical protein